jgi:carboxymethylenebutenolidase
MNTSRIPTHCWTALALPLLLAAGASEARSLVLEGAGKGTPLPLFLDVFRQDRRPAIVTQGVTIDSAVGPVRGSLARPDTRERLPAVLLLPPEAGLTDWMKENARDLASIGYVVLALERSPGRTTQARGAWPALADEPTLAEQSAALRWLRRRPDVWPDRLGVVGWSLGGGQALALAAAAPVQACVVCDGPVSDEPALLAGLRGTPVLGVFAGKAGAAKALPAFRRALTRAGIPHKVAVFRGAEPGFMCPANAAVYAREAAEQAYVEVYEFLGKYVEDAPQNSPTARPAAGGHPAEKEFASIADLMRAVNEPTGVRGTLDEALAHTPGKRQDWERVRANAAVIAEAGNLLRVRTPPKGFRDHWLQQVEAYTAAAEGIVEAADRRDYAGARRGLQELSARCAVCHRQHR